MLSTETIHFKRYVMLCGKVLPERSAALDAFGYIRKARLEFGEIEMEDGICATLSNGVNQ